MSILNTKRTNDGIFSNKTEKNFNLAKIFLNVRVRRSVIDHYELIPQYNTILK